MKVLYWPIVNDYASLPINIYKGDYVVDALFHGFRKMLGEDCIDTYKMSHCYKGQMDWENIKTTGHKGWFSLYDRLEDINIDRTHIVSKITKQYFDYIVMPIHHTNRGNQQQILSRIGFVSKFYPPEKIAVICGDEDPNQHWFVKDHGKCHFFKCEIEDKKIGQASPVAFCVPKENVVRSIPQKDMDFMPLIPSFLYRGHPHERTYVYKDEETYFNDYKRSYFGFTCKKGGWDCMRHYEMLACGCLPFFTDVEQCPVMTLATYPKQYCIRIKEMAGIHPNVFGPQTYPKKTYIGTCMDRINTTGHYIDHDKFNHEKYHYMLEDLLDYTRRYLTTEHQAKRIINNLKAQQ